MRTDIYFAADDSHTFLPWLIGIMVFLAALLLCLGVSVNGWVLDKGVSYSDSFTVNIPAETPKLDDALPKLEQALQSEPGVKSLRRLPDSELQELLKPWLGESSAMSGLPLPVVFEAALERGAEMDYAALQARVSGIAPGTEIDTRETWVAAFASFSSAIHMLTLILAVLIIAGMGMMISFTSRAALRLHARTVNLLHSIGAEDRYITRQFQLEAFRLVLPGALAGALAAGAAYFAAGLYIASLQASVMPPLSMAKSHYILLAAMPAVCTLVAWLVARLTVTQELERTL